MPVPQWVHDQAKARGNFPEYLFTSNMCTQSVSVLCTRESTSVGICSIDSVPGHGWVSRLKVEPFYRGRGIGEELLYRAIKASACFGFERIVVEPGGYGTPLKPLRRWYRMQGFGSMDGFPDSLELVL